MGSDRIDCRAFLEVLTVAGFELWQDSARDKANMMSLVRMISCIQSNDSRGLIDHRVFMDDLMNRPHTWWN